MCHVRKESNIHIFFFNSFGESYAPVEFIAISFNILDTFSIKRRNTTYKQLSRIKAVAMEVKGKNV